MSAARSHSERFLYRFGYTSPAFRALLGLGRMLGRNVSRSIGRIVGRSYAVTQPGVVDVVRKNLSLLKGRAFSPDEASQVFVNYGETLADYLWLGSRKPDVGFSLVEFSGGLDRLQSALASGKGAILATGHYGFFELGALVLGQMGFPVSVVTFPEPSPALTRWRADYRLRWGAETIELAADAFSSLRVNEALERGRFTAMLVDRPVGGRTVDVDLPGGRIPFSSAPAILAWMSGCAVVPVDVRKTKAGKYAIRAGEPVRCDTTLPRNEAIAKCTRQVASDLLEGFRQDPLQWYQFVPVGVSTT
ncbi:MAG: lysophospholipid acyltransferase family protein [Terrimicrobiaceae bacterium]